ncbi:MAG: magnesium-translocating P-type ATPase [Streptococcaceae bacterium]|jgi:Mg2+-importing ATPase|nr:magnesium-translocating P-type ATPase [Streptococcaceae bacterium]
MQKMKNVSKNDDLKELAQLNRDELFERLNTTFTGLNAEQAEERLDEYGLNIVASQKPTPWYVILFHAVRNPFVFVLVFLAIVSELTGDIEGALYMMLMVSVSAIVSFVQEYKSQKASIALHEMIENTTNVKRDGENFEIPMDEVVPGDIIQLQTGDMIPADAILLSHRDLFINQASLTGESFPVEKRLAEDFDEDERIDWGKTTALDAPNVLFMGTDVLSGNGEILIVKTGMNTMFGNIASKATETRVESAFDKGLSRVSRLLLTMVAIMFPIVLVINWITKGNFETSFFFAIAVAVGLTPEMLPMIVNANLAKGATVLSKEKVIVKNLSAIQNLGSMDILCTDKTGTITEDRVVMVDYVNSYGNKDNAVLNSAFINSNFQTGWKNLMDVAVIDFFKKQKFELPNDDIVKVDEIPFDFSRRLLSVVVQMDNQNLMVTKGAVEEMQAICTHVMENGQRVEITDERLAEMKKVNREMNLQGMRVLTIAERVISDADLEDFDTSFESDMTLIGFIGFLDPAKESAEVAIKSLQAHGVTVKVLTGDNAIVAQKVCEDVGIPAARYVIGSEIDEMNDEELFNVAMEVHLFAKLNPMQKARIIELLRKVHTVGFMGDGINDAPSLRAADVGISVDTAADITKDASNIILLEKSLQVLETGVIEGRKVFNNMMKYIRITLSSNFGNVFSVLIASAFLPFLPMLSLQILTLNLIYDMSQLAIPWDNVDEEEINRPVKWETKGLAKFAAIFGPTSSIFDITTFLVLWYVFKFNTLEHQALFQAGWFAESLGTQALAFHILRTKKIPFFQSIPSVAIIISTICAFLVGGILLFTQIGAIISLTHLPVNFYFYWLLIISAYLLLLQFVKSIYYKNHQLM